MFQILIPAFRRLFPIGVLALFTATLAGQSRNVGPELVTDINVVVESPELVEGLVGYAAVPRATVDLGLVMSGESHRFKLNINNMTGQDIVFRTISVSCACGKIEVDGNALPSGVITPIELTYNAPRQGLEGKSDVRISFFGDDLDMKSLPLAELRLTASLAGILSIDQAASLFEVPKAGVSTLKFPVTCTDPVRFDALKIEKPLAFANVKTELIEEGQYVSLVLVVDSATLPPEGLRGRIDLVDTMSSRRADINIAIELQKAISISPHLLRFRVPEESKDGALRAMALLRLNPEAIPTGKHERDEDEVADKKTEVRSFSIGELACFLGDEPVRTEWKALSGNLTRVDLFLDQKQVEQFRKMPIDDSAVTRKIKWQIKLIDVDLPLFLETDFLF